MSKMEIPRVEKLVRLFQVKKTQLKIARDRGYDISNEEALLDYTPEAFVEYYSGTATQTGQPVAELLSTYYSDSERRRLLYVYYALQGGGQLGVNVTREFAARISTEQATEGILVTDTPLSSQASDTLVALGRDRVQVFMLEELAFNVIEHSLVPKHEVLSPEEGRDLLKKMNAALSGLPIILTSDPVVKHYNWPPGRIVKITRREYFLSVLVPETYYYRVIVAA
jgi:DNA-directed RNA polymerase I, II, and III subunit RPABC1